MPATGKVVFPSASPSPTPNFATWESVATSSRSAPNRRTRVDRTRKRRKRRRAKPPGRTSSRRISRIPSRKVRKARSQFHTHSIFAENLEDSVAVRKGAESAVGAAHAATHSIFAEETAEEAAAATRANLGGKAVSETMKRSLFEGNRLFDDDAEAAAVEAARAKATARDDASRTTSRAHHVGHGVLGADWTTPREEGEEGGRPRAPSPVGGAPPAMRTPEVDKNFKPFGAQTPAVDLRWKTEEEDERETAVATLVAEAIARVVRTHEA